MLTDNNHEQKKRFLAMSAVGGYNFTKIEKQVMAASSPSRTFERCRRDPLPCGMIIVPSTNLKYNEETGKYTVITEKPDTSTECPLCDGFLKYRDSRDRDAKDIEGDVWHFSLRRLRCMLCKKLHTEIPDIIHPYKHYNSEAIQGVLDGDESVLNSDIDDSTIRRWKSEFAKAEPGIERGLASVDVNKVDEKIADAYSITATLTAIRATIERWLAFVVLLLTNNGHKLCTQFAFCLSPGADKIQSAGKNNDGGCKNNDNIGRENGCTDYS